MSCRCTCLIRTIDGLEWRILEMRDGEWTCNAMGSMDQADVVCWRKLPREHDLFYKLYPDK